MKKIYDVNKQNIIEQLQNQGIKVCATNNIIEYIEIETSTHNITDIENLTGLKFKERGK